MMIGVNMASESKTNWLVYGGVAIATAIGGIEGADRVIETPIEKEVKYVTAVMVADSVQLAKIQAEEVEFRKVGEEIKSKRTPTQEVFKGPMVQAPKGKLQEFRANVHSVQKYFHDPDGDSLMALDLTVREVEPPSIIEQVVEGLKGVVGIEPQRQTHNRYVKAGPYAATWFDSTSYDYTIATMDGADKVGFKSLHNKRNMQVVTNPTAFGVKQTWILNDSTAARVLKWKVNATAPLIHDGGRVLSGKFVIEDPVAWDADSTAVPVAVSVSGDTLTYTVSDVNVKWPVYVDPTTNISTSYSGYINTYSQSYDLARGIDGTFYSVTYSSTKVGQELYTWWSGDTYYFNHRIWRSYLKFAIPDMDSLGAASLVLTGVTNSSQTDFNINILNSTWMETLSINSWNLFSGFTNYYSPFNGTIQNDVWSSASYSTTNTINFNTTGKSGIFYSRNGSIKYALLSSRDYSHTEPTQMEFAVFSGATLSLTYYIFKPLSPTGFLLHHATTTSMLASWTNHHSLNVSSLRLFTGIGELKKSLSVTDTNTTITGLTANTQYIFKARVDSASYYAYSNADTLYTLANPPNAWNFTEVFTDTTKIKIGFGTNGNPANTVYAIRDSTNQKWIDAAGAQTTTKTWRTATEWTSTNYLVSRDPNVRHVIGVVAKNVDGVETAYVWSSLAIGNVKYIQIPASSWYKHTAQSATYLTARNDTTWANIASTVSAGQIGQDTGFSVSRSSFVFPIPLMDYALSCSLGVTGTGNSTTTDFRPVGFPGFVQVNFNVGGGGIYVNNRYWTTEDNPARRFFAFHQYPGHPYGAFNGYNMLSNWSTTSYATSMAMPFTPFGLGAVEASAGEYLRFTVISSRDSSGTQPTGAEYFGFNAPKLLFRYVLTDKVPENVVVASTSVDSVIVTWTDKTTTESGFAIVNALTGARIGGNDSTGANTTVKRIGGLSPNTQHVYAVMVLGGKLAGQVSNPDTCYTQAAKPDKPAIFYAGGNVWDESGNNRHGTASNVRFSKDVGDSSYGAYDFNGTTSYINAGVDCIGTGPVTVCGWMKPKDTTPAVSGHVVDNGRFRFGMRSTGTLFFVGPAGVKESAAVPADRWFFFSVTVDQFGIVNFRVDNATSGAENQDSGARLTAIIDLYIGNNAVGDRAFDGLIDDLRIYNRVLSVAEQDSIYQYGVCNDYQVGPELITNGDFSSWSGAADPNNTPTGWAKSGVGAASYVANNGGAARLVSDGTRLYISQPVTIGKTYIYSGNVLSIAGTAKFANSVQTIKKLALGINSGIYTSEGVTFNIQRTAACDVTIDNVSVREVIPGSSLALWYSFDLPTNRLKFVVNKGANPDPTELAIQDSLSGLYIHSFAGVCSLMANEDWKPQATWGALFGDTLFVNPGKKYNFRTKARSFD